MLTPASRAIAAMLAPPTPSRAMHRTPRVHDARPARPSTVAATTRSIIGRSSDVARARPPRGIPPPEAAPRTRPVPRAPRAPGRRRAPVSPTGRVPSSRTASSQLPELVAVAVRAVAASTSTRARSGTSSPKTRSIGARSTMRRPSVCSAWKPTMRIVFRGSEAPCARWCRMRPASAIPEAAMMTIGPCCELSAFDSLGVARVAHERELEQVLHLLDEVLGPVEDLGMHREHGRRVDRERAVDVDRDLGDLPVARQHVQVVDELLRAADGERGDQHAAAARGGLAHHACELRRARPSTGAWSRLPYVDSMITTSAPPVGGFGSRMIGSPFRPTSPENTMRFRVPPSVHSRTTDAEPRMCPASMKVARTPGTTSNHVSYGTPTIRSTAVGRVAHPIERRHGFSLRASRGTRRPSPGCAPSRRA